MLHKLKILNKNSSYSRLKNYKPNDVVTRGDKVWQNSSGLNTPPGENLNDWIDITLGVEAAVEKTPLVEFNNFLPVESNGVYKFSTKKVDTITDLRLTKGDEEGQIITLLGYHNSGDKNPLNYKFSLTKGSDDGGSVINSSNGSWIIASDVVTIKDFGAKGDNIQDDTSFIQKAFDFINSEKKKEFGGFREIIIPKGVFKITKALKFPTETSLIGEGITNSVIKTLNNNHNAIEVKEDTLVEANELKQGERTFLSSFSVRGILYGVNPFGAFDQERIRVNSSNSGIVVDSVLRVTLNNISTKGFESRGMYFTNTYYNSVVNSESGNNKVGLEVSNISTSLHCINSEFRLNSQGIRITNTSYANRFVSCLVEANIANYTDKISFLNSSANYSGVGVVIENSFMNTFTDSYVEAHVLQIYLLNSYRNKFSNSFFAAGSHGESFPMNTLDGHSGLLLNSDNNSFIDNEYTTSYSNVKCRFWFVNSKNALFEFTNNDNFNEFITESSETLNSLPVADENPKAFYKGGNKSYINGVRGAYSASVTLGDEANSPKISGSLAMINGELTYYDGSNHLTVDYKNSPLVKRRGTTAERPNANDVVSGYEYYDTDIKKPIYSDNVANVWLNSMGEIV